MLIDDTSIWSSDDTRGAGRGSFTLGEGWDHLLKQLLMISVTQGLEHLTNYVISIFYL